MFRTRLRGRFPYSSFSLIASEHLGGVRVSRKEDSGTLSMNNATCWHANFVVDCFDDCGRISVVDADDPTVPCPARDLSSLHRPARFRVQVPDSPLVFLPSLLLRLRSPTGAVRALLSWIHARSIRNRPSCARGFLRRQPQLRAFTLPTCKHACMQACWSAS